MTSSNINKKSEIVSLTKTDDGVQKRVRYKRNLRMTGPYWRYFYTKKAAQIDWLNVIDYRSDTILIMQTYVNYLKGAPVSTLIFSKKGRIRDHGIGPLDMEEDGEGTAFHPGHPAVIDSIMDWDMEELRDVISRIGTKPGQVTTFPHVFVIRIVVSDNKKASTSVVDFDEIIHPGIRLSEDGVNYEIIKDVHEIPSNISD
jgi:hypothetical protein